jgi:hypothetical protein
MHTCIRACACTTVVECMSLVRVFVFVCTQLYVPGHISVFWQGAEYDVIKGALSADGEGILDRIKTMVISTHSTVVEHKIFAMLCSEVDVCICLCLCLCY